MSVPRNAPEAAEALIRRLFEIENGGRGELAATEAKNRGRYEMLARWRWARKHLGDECAADIEDDWRRHAHWHPEAWHGCLMILLERGECLRNEGSGGICWPEVKKRLGRRPKSTGRSGNPGASFEKFRLIYQAVQILIEAGYPERRDAAKRDDPAHHRASGVTLDAHPLSACAIVARAVRLQKDEQPGGKWVGDPDRNEKAEAAVEDKWRKYRDRRSIPFRLYGEPCLRTALARLEDEENISQ